MATKREWLRELKAIKKEPRELSPAECDELILLLGGTTRPNHRPEVTVFGMNRRQLNFSSIGSVVFGYLENAEQLVRAELEIQELSSPDFMKKYQATFTSRWSEVHQSKPTPKNVADAVRITKENVAAEIAWREDRIAMLRPISAKSLAHAGGMASAWFGKRGITLTAKKIQNELGEIQRRAELKSLGLVEWRELMAIENARAARCNARALKEIKKKEVQSNE